MSPAVNSETISIALLNGFGKFLIKSNVHSRSAQLIRLRSRASTITNSINNFAWYANLQAKYIIKAEIRNYIRKAYVGKNEGCVRRVVLQILCTYTSVYVHVTQWIYLQYPEANPEISTRLLITNIPSRTHLMSRTFNVTYNSPQEYLSCGKPLYLWRQKLG